MILKRSFQIYSFFFIALLVYGCGQKKNVDVSGINLDLRIERFDKEMNKLSAANLSTEAPLLEKKYGSFYRDYMEGMLSAGSTADTAYYANLRSILNDQDYTALRNEVTSKFPDLHGTEEALTDAFKHVMYYYPQQKIPKPITFISGFSVQTPIGDGYIGIGLDMFLGADSKFYPSLRQSIPLYISKRFTPENITPRVMETFVREEMFPEPATLTNFLDRMIYNGKILYVMDAFMPAVPDSLKIGYSSQQQQWTQEYESQVWGYFLEQNLLYETDYMKIQKYFADAPFTPGIGERNDSAPKLGSYIGWQIVKTYMEKNDSVSLQELMKDSDYQTLLNRAKYKPK